MTPSRPTEAELKRQCRWKIEDIELKRDQGRLTDAERDAGVAKAWDDLTQKLEALDGDA